MYGFTDYSQDRYSQGSGVLLELLINIHIKQTSIKLSKFKSLEVVYGSISNYMGGGRE